MAKLSDHDHFIYRTNSFFPFLQKNIIKKDGFWHSSSQIIFCVKSFANRYWNWPIGLNGPSAKEWRQLYRSSRALHFEDVLVTISLCIFTTKNILCRWQVGARIFLLFLIQCKVYLFDKYLLLLSQYFVYLLHTFITLF